ncbi:MAG: UrcA family protein [Hyphomonas sp.]
MKRFILAAAFAATAFTAPAFAASDSFKMDINYSSKNLVSRAGAETEYDHIRKQVADRCIAEHAGLHFAADYAQTMCVRKTMDRAVRSIGDAQLTQIHTERR